MPYTCTCSVPRICQMLIIMYLTAYAHLWDDIARVVTGTHSPLTPMSPHTHNIHAGLYINSEELDKSCWREDLIPTFNDCK